MMAKQGGSAKRIKVHDKVSYHYPEGKDCPSLAAGKRHIEFIYKLLAKHDLLSEEGLEVIAGRLGADSSLTSEDVTPEGNAILNRHYDGWLEGMEYGGPLRTEYWEGKLPPAVSAKKAGPKVKPAISWKVSKTAKAAKPAPAAKPAKATKPVGAEPILYDRVDFHWPECKAEGCKTIADAKSHLDAVMNWMAGNGLLTPKGKSALKNGKVADDFELREDLMTPLANTLLKKNFDTWFGGLKYGPGPHDTSKLDKALAKLK